MSGLETAHLPRAASLREGALEVIRQAIVSGQLRPGEIHSVSAFAAHLGVSPSPVREAMLTLVHRGIMEPVRNRGFRVVPMTRHDLDEVYQLRLMLEVPAVAALADREDLPQHTPVLRQLAEAIEEAAQAGDIQHFLESDREFHLTMLGIGGNRRLVETVSQLRDQTRLYGLEALVAQGLLVGSAAEHRAMVDALTAADKDALSKLMTAHLSHIVGEWSSGVPGDQ